MSYELCSLTSSCSMLPYSNFFGDLKKYPPYLHTGGVRREVPKLQKSAEKWNEYLLLNLEYDVLRNETSFPPVVIPEQAVVYQKGLRWAPPPMIYANLLSTDLQIFTHSS